MQYILFNKSTNSGGKATSFSNSNICLGILKDSRLERKNCDTLTNEVKTGIHSYISGMYLDPHYFVAQGELDEICIDFTPLGFYKFFKFKAKKYILGEDVLSEGLGRNAIFSFEQVFEQSDDIERGKMIERILLEGLLDIESNFLEKSIYAMRNDYQQSIFDVVKVLGCNERKLQRTFQTEFDITPKQFLRINRFRSVMNAITESKGLQNFTALAYQHGFNDQSHLVKEIRKFTGQSPKQLATSLHNIDDKVVVAV